MKIRDVIRLIEADGWRLATQRGSHRQFKHLTKTAKVTVAGHPAVELGPKTLRSIMGSSGYEEMKYAVIYEKTATGYSAYLPDLPGCIAAGATLEETSELMRGAKEMHLDAMIEDGDPIPEPTTVADYIALPA